MAEFGQVGIDCSVIVASRDLAKCTGAVTARPAIQVARQHEPLDRCEDGAVRRQDDEIAGRDLAGGGQARPEAAGILIEPGFNPRCPTGT